MAGGADRVYADQRGGVARWAGVRLELCKAKPRLDLVCSIKDHACATPVIDLGALVGSCCVLHPRTGQPESSSRPPHSRPPPSQSCKVCTTAWRCFPERAVQLGKFSEVPFRFFGPAGHPQCASVDGKTCLKNATW
jgi:hypothetical protein